MERTPGFESATDEDVQTARFIGEGLSEQSLAYGDQHDSSTLAPAWYGKKTPYTLDTTDWSFLERWFTDPRLGQWAMEAIGEVV